MRNTLLAGLLSLLPLLVTTGCSDEDGASTTVTVAVSEAAVSRCNQSMDFSDFELTMTLTSAGSEAVVLDQVTVTGDVDPASGEPLVSGTIAFESAPVVLEAGQSTRFRCSPGDLSLRWPASETGTEGHQIAVSVSFTSQGGGAAETASGRSALTFREAFDSCDTFAGTPHACRPSDL